ncbi:MAG: polysaccharide biosynthesis protein [Caulobacterales bacterium]|nr:polysaccharide biosynthesis protein [Caulobacterales bacterium]
MSRDTHAPPARPAIVKALVTGYDLAAAWLAMWLGVNIRYAISPGMETSDTLPYLAAFLFTLACAIVFPLQGLHRGVWRFTALNDILRICNAVALANLVFLLALFFVNRLLGMPRASLLIEAPLLIALLVSARLLRQILASGDWRAVARLEDRALPAAILAGSHEALNDFLRDLNRRPGGPPIRVRGLVEPGASERGRSIRGVPLLGGPKEAESALISLSQANGAPAQLVLVDASLRREQVDALVRAGAAAGAMVVRSRGERGGELSPLDAADLLGRPQRVLSLAAPRRFVEGRRVLVTGAGGTIGSELTRQLLRLGPSTLALMDSSELNLFEIDLELREAGRATAVEPILSDVRDAARVREIVEAVRPEVVFHAAALKHVPLMERNPVEAVLTNVLGTMHVAEAARDAGAGAFVLISTDKAVHPTNVMGASKRAAELFVQALDAEPGPFQALSVRFGNVLGSTGSVVPLFERQIARGGPITVTHPEITRYFMTVEEAAALVLQAAALGDEHPSRAGVFVLDMGEPVRIEDLARQLCRLRGLTPDQDVAIVHTGLRPGEKVHEDLFYGTERVSETSVDGVLFAEARMIPLAMLRPRLERIIEAGRARDRAAMFEAVRALIPDFQSTANGGARSEAAPRR